MASDFVQEEGWLKWMDGAARTGMSECLGYGLKAWGVLSEGEEVEWILNGRSGDAVCVEVV